MRPVFEFNRYVEYLKHVVSENKSRRGFQGQLALQAGCHPTFLSQVLSERAQLGREHALAMADFLSLSEDEGEYLLGLIDLERAGSERLRNHMRKKLSRLASEAGRSRPIPNERLRSHEEESYYYGKWYRSAIHLLAETSEYSSPQKMAERLRMPVAEVKTVLAELQALGLLKKKNGKWLLCRSSVHLPPEAAIADHYHALWRMQAALQPSSPSHFRYTGLHTVSRKHERELRAALSDFIGSFRKVTTQTTPEELITLNVDFFVV